MNKHFLVAVFLLAFSGLPQMAKGDATVKESNSQINLAQRTTPILGPGAELGLRNYCILPEGVGKAHAPSDSPDCAIRTTRLPDHPFQTEIWVKRDKCCVAIIRKELDGKVILNPKGFDYGPIPPLRDITARQADELWATENGKTVNGDVVSYKLISYQAPADLSIDVVFHNGKIQKYRIRSAQISPADWYQVQ